MGRIYVVGSINMDVVALAERHPQLGETVRGRNLKFFPGGKGANQAVAACRAGAETYMVGMLGHDTFANELRAFLANEHIDLSFVGSAPDTPSGTALITVAGGENTIVVVPGANDTLTAAQVSVIPYSADSIVVAQFETPQESVRAAFEAARRVGAKTILNPAPAATPVAGLLDATDILIVNESELSMLANGTSVAEMSPEEAVSAARAVKRDRDQVVVVTLGANGLVALSGEGVVRIDGHIVDATDTTGAGDCFVGNLAAGLARTSELEEALVIANRAAALSVQTLGAASSMPYRDDVTSRAAA
jgi:ribokinase